MRLHFETTPAASKSMFESEELEVYERQARFDSYIETERGTWELSSRVLYLIDFGDEL